ncbi:thioredoxin [archaeon]|mgnify:FL=1|jgi:thioredoxin 1|nr:thioredoxin [Candidatus Woesearchaeota archaeon]MBT3464475.1 thioredoxin [archaeon]MBT4352855.1 thioredoxin [archaeon]MBT4647975.1 thioredoxin [archaeon]MBT6822640.1 thioredoxin [archaeon]
MAEINITSENYEAEVKNSDIPVIVDFWAEWCGPCKMMGPVFAELSEEYTGKLKFAKVDTESQPDVAGQHQIRGIPCLIVFNKGEEVDRIVGFAPKEAMKEKIEKVLGSI